MGMAPGFVHNVMTDRHTPQWSAEDLHSCLKVKYSVRCRHSWFPRSRKRVVGWLIFSDQR